MDDRFELGGLELRADTAVPIAASLLQQSDHDRYRVQYARRLEVQSKDQVCAGCNTNPERIDICQHS